MFKKPNPHVRLEKLSDLVQVEYLTQYCPASARLLIKNISLSGVLLASLILASQSSCLRYVPSREEITAAGGDAIAGEEEFYAYERRQEERLQALVQERGAQAAKEGDTVSYQIGVGDLLDIKVFEVPELNTTSRVSQEGVLTLPLVGDMHPLGKTLAEFRSELTERLRTYVRNPQAQVGIAEYEGHKVSVIGEVVKPGVYPLKHKGFTLNELLSEAGGRTERASSRIILIPGNSRSTRGSLGGDPAGLSAGAPSPAPVSQPASGVEFDLDQLIGSADRRPVMVPLLSGDTVIVPEAGMFSVDGEVIKPGSYALSSRVSAIGAIAAAGGLTYSADVDKVEIIREVGEGKKAAVTMNLEEVALKGGRDIRLRNGDYVRVPSASGRFRTRQVVEVLNGFFRIGVNASPTN